MPTLIIILVVSGVILVIKLLITSDNAANHWQHYFDEFTYSSQDFYKSLDAILKEKQIPNATIKRTNYSEAGMFSANREYLRVERENLVFDICAAPFAKGFFISSWQGETLNIFEQFVSAIPFIGSYLKRKMFQKTFYQLDLEQMFITAVHSSVLEAIKAMTQDMGARDLTELEMRFNSLGK